MRVLRDALVTWRCFAVEAVQDQRILTQTLALESYEQALSEVGDERAALEERVAALRASVVGLEDKLLRQTEEFVAEFARLQAEEHARAAAEQARWSHALAEAQREAQAMEDNHVSTIKRLQDTVAARSGERDDLADRLRSAGQCFDEFQRAVQAKRSGASARAAERMQKQACHRLRRRAFNSLVRAVDLGARGREAKLTVRLGLSLRAVLAWRWRASETGRTRRCIEKAQARWTRALVFAVLREWRACVMAGGRSERIARRAKAKLVRFRLRTATAAWRQRSMEQTVLKRKALKIGQRMLRSGLWISFDTWRCRRVVVDELRQRVQAWYSLADHAVTNRRRWTVPQRLMAFERWRQYTVNRMSLRHAGRKGVLRLVNKTLAMTFARWRENVCKEKRLRSTARRALQRILNRSLSKGFRQWCHYVAEVKRLKALGAKVVRRLQAAGMATSFERWARNVKEKRTARMLLTRCVTKMTNVGLHAAFSMWTHRIQQMRGNEFLMRKIAMKWTLFEISVSFATWASRCSESSRARGLLERVSSRSAQDGSRSSFLRWSQIMKKCARARSFLSLQQLRWLGQALRTWHGGAMQAGRLRKRIHHFVEHHERLKQREALTKLLYALEETRRDRKLLFFVLKRLKFSWQMRIFCLWNSALLEARQVQAACWTALTRKLLKHLNTRMLVAALHEWTEIATQSRILAETESDAWSSTADQVADDAPIKATTDVHVLGETDVQGLHPSFDVEDLVEALAHQSSSPDEKRGEGEDTRGITTPGNRDPGLTSPFTTPLATWHQRRVPLSAIQVLAETEAIWDRVIEGRRATSRPSVATSSLCDQVASSPSFPRACLKPDNGSSQHFQQMESGPEWGSGFSRAWTHAVPVASESLLVVPSSASMLESKLMTLRSAGRHLDSLSPSSPRVRF